MTRDTIRWVAISALAAAAGLTAAAAHAATFAELAARQNGGSAYAPGPESRCANGPQGNGCVPWAQPGMPAVPQGVLPAPLNTPAAAQVPPGGWTPPEAYLPFNHSNGLPNGRLQVWSFGQMNSTTDPFNPAGLSTPFMFVPWSTPLSAWTNAQTWNWWRERAGVLPPYW